MKKQWVIVAAAVAGAALIAAGIVIGQKYFRKPAVVGALSVLTYAPQGSDVPIDADGVTVMFNKAIVPLTTLDAGRDRAVPLTISPSIGGKFFWLGTHGFIFRPEELLDPATTYRVEMPTGLVSVDGYQLEQPLTWEFSTVGPRVLQVQPGDGDTLLPRQASFFVRFNLMMDEADVEKNLKITDAATGAAVEGGQQFQWGDDGHTLRVVFKKDLPWSAGVAVELPRGLRAKKGSIGTAEAVTLGYITPDKEMTLERVINVDYDVEEDSETGVREKVFTPGKEATVTAGTGICFVFSQAIEQESFKKAFRAELIPEKDAAGVKDKKPLFYYYFTDYEGFPVALEKGDVKTLEGHRRACVSFLDEYHRSYTFSIDPKKIASLSGAPLVGGGDTYRVKTRHAFPSLRSLVTKNILSFNAPMRLPYRGMNVGAVTMRLYRITDKDHYDEGIKDERIWSWNLKPKVSPPVSEPLGGSHLELPIDAASMTIDQARMPATIVHEIPVTAKEDVSARFLFDLSELPQKIEPGIYLVEAVPAPSVEAPKLKERKEMHAVYTMIQVTPVGLAMKREVDHALVWATDIESGQPIADLPVKIVFSKWNSEQGHRDVKGEALVQTNEQGVAVAAAVDGEGIKACAEVTDPARASYSCEEEHRIGYGRWPLKPGTDYYAYVYTDRPIYRPGQKVFFSSFVRQVREGRYFMPDAKTPVAVKATDASGDEIFTVPKAELMPGGIVSGSFDLPDGDDAPRGTYQLTIEIGKQHFTRLLTVASYRKPSFKVDLAAKSPEIVSGEELEVAVQGDYFFGAPMRKAKTDWSIMTSTFFFAPEGFLDFSFIDGDLLQRHAGEEEGDYDYESDFEYDIVASSGATHAEDDSQTQNPRGVSPGHRGGRFFEDAKGDEVSMEPARLGDDGKLFIRYRPDLKKYPTSQTLTVEAGVEDPAHQQVSGAEDVIVHKAEVYLGLKPQKWTYGAKETAGIDVVSLDTKGKPASGASFSVDVVRREYKFIERRNASGFWTFLFQHEDTKLKTIPGKTDGEGKTIVSYVLPQGGEFRFVAKGKDGRGNAFQSATTIYAWGENYVPWRFDRPEELELVPDKDAYKIGETAKILIKSLVPVTKAMMTYERGRVLEYQIIELGGNASHIEIPITEGMIPNLFVNIVAHAGRDGNRPPMLFAGNAELRIEPERKRLNVKITPDRKAQGDDPPIYRPGDEVKVRIQTTDGSGAPRPAHVMISVADESVLRLLNYQLPDLVEKFYYRRPDGVVTSSSLVSLKAGDAGKGAGKKRRIFRDTAHFVANLTTNEKGEGSFSFKLPDDLTTWVIEALAATEPISFAAFEEERKKAAPERPAGQRAMGVDLVLSDHNLVGGSRGKIMTTLPVVLRAALPRFAAWGDTIVGKVIATNRTPEAATGTLLVSTSGDAVLKGKVPAKEITLNVAPGAEETYPIDLEIISASGGKFLFSAEATDARGETIDSFEVGVPVEDRFAPEVVATSGMTREGEKEQIDLPKDIVRDRGGVDVSFRASLALAAAPSLKNLFYFPWGCSEQKSATLIALLLARDLTEKLGEPYFDAMAPLPQSVIDAANGLDEKRKLLDEKIQAIATELIDKFQHYGGGIRYWPDSPRPNFLASAQVLWGLTVAAQRGFSVEEVSRQKLRSYLRSELEKNAALGWDAKAFGFWTLSLELITEADLGAGYADHVPEMSISGVSYLVMAMKNVGSIAASERLVGKILSTAKQEPRHTSWPASKFFWSSAAKNTALAAGALFKVQPDDPQIPRALAFLLNRKKAAPCLCTQDNLYVSWFITEYAKAMKEDEADFTASLAAGKKVLAEASFDQKNLLEMKTTALPMEEVAGLPMPVDLAVAKDGDGVLYYDLVLKYYLPPDQQPTREEGLIISREFYALDDEKEERPLSAFKAGENYKGHIIVVAPQQMNYVVVEDLLPAGFEPIDMTLATSSGAADLAARRGSEHEGVRTSWSERYDGYDDVIPVADYGMSWGFPHQEIRDDSIAWSDELVPAGVYHIRYPIRATTAGTFLWPGARAFEFYEPEIFGRSLARMIEIAE